MKTLIKTSIGTAVGLGLYILGSSLDKEVKTLSNWPEVIEYTGIAILSMSVGYLRGYGKRMEDEELERRQLIEESEDKNY